MKSLILRCLAHCERSNIAATIESIARQCGEPPDDVLATLNALVDGGLVQFDGEHYLLVRGNVATNESEIPQEPEPEPTPEPPTAPPEPEPEPPTPPPKVESEPVSPPPEPASEANETAPEQSTEGEQSGEYPRASLEHYVYSLNHAVTEVRILRKRPHLNGTWVGRRIYGYFDNVDDIESCIAPYLQDPDTGGIYTTLHACNPELLSRCYNRLKEGNSDDSTKDHEITNLSVFPIDIDPERSSGISANTSDILTAQERINEIQEWFAKRGIEMMLAMSGNGWHLLGYLEHTPASEANIALLKETGDRVGAHWDSDVTIYNPARIWKLYGTWARKGDNSQERPHRQARIRLPENLNEIPRYTLEDLAKVIAELPEPTADEPRTQTPQTAQQRPRKQQQGVYSSGGKRLPEIATKEDWERIAGEAGATGSGGWKSKAGGWDVKRVYCPFCNRANHAFISFGGTGKYGFKCHSNTCKSSGDPNHQSLYQLAGYASAPRPTDSSWLPKAVFIQKKKAEAHFGMDLPLWREVQEGDFHYYIAEDVPCDKHNNGCTGNIIITLGAQGSAGAPQFQCRTDYEKEKDNGDD